MKRFIVITSIFPPTDAVKKFARLEGWRLIVVGDKKTPRDWFWEGVQFISDRAQKRLNYEILGKLPWNHYARKMIGYLFAIENGAEVIVDTDDDNIPHKNWELPSFHQPYNLTLPAQGFVNIYKYKSIKSLRVIS